MQRAAVKEYPDYEAEAALRQEFGCEGITYTLEGRADGLFTDRDGMRTIDEIKTTTLPPEFITGEQSPEHWAQAQCYAAIYALQNDLPAMRVRLTYYQVDEELEFNFTHDYTAEALQDIVQGLLTQYAPWARRAAAWQRDRRASLQALTFPFAGYRPGQRAMIGAVYKTCCEGGQLLCQAPTGIGKTMSVLFPALKALEDGGPVFYLTARGTTRAAAENAVAVLHDHDASLKLRSVTLTAKDKICLQDRRECTPEACPYANGYFDRVKTALWDGLDTPTLTADALRELARRHRVCPFELGLGLWCDVVIGDYNYLFDPVVHLARFFESRGDYLFLVDEAHNLPGRARDMHSASLCKSAFFDARKRLGKGKSSLKNALTKINNLFIEWRHRCEEAEGRTFFERERADAFDRALQKLCEPLEIWLDEHRDPDYDDVSLTQNTRVGYPAEHIPNSCLEGAGGEPTAVIFLTCDAFGVLPPVSILTPEQTQYYFLSGFTAKLAGTERGITEPTPTFSACFGQAFLELHPTKYAEELVKKMQKSGAKAYLVNTGWNGTGKRISIKDTRGIIDAILSGAINEAPTKKIPYFDFEVPTALPGVDPAILDPRDTYADAAQWEEKAKDLAGRFIKNFAKYEGNEHGKALVSAGPQL